MPPILHLSANLSEITFKSTAINKNLINTVLDLSGNNYTATATGNVYLENYEGIKAFSFKSNANTTLYNSSFNPFTTGSWTIACTSASQDVLPVNASGVFFCIGGNQLAGHYIGIYKDSGVIKSSSTSAADVNFNTVPDPAYQKWNSYITTYDSTTNNIVFYVNGINTFASIVRVKNITAGYYLNCGGSGYSTSYGVINSYTSEAMVFSQCLTDSQITGLFGYFQKNLSASTTGYSKQVLRQPVFSRKGA